MSKLLVVLADLADRPVNRSVITWASWARSAGREVSVLSGHGGDLAPLAASVGPVVDTSSVNDLKVARLAGRLGLAPAGRLLKSRQVRSMVADLGAADGVLVAEPAALDLLGWLRSDAQRIVTVVPALPSPPAVEERMAAAGSTVALVDPDDPLPTQVGSTTVDVGLMVRSFGAGPDDPVAVAGLSGDQLDRFVEVARSIRRVRPTARIGWVRDDAVAADDRWAWPLFGRGDLVDLAGVVTAVPAAGTEPVSAVIEAGPLHPLVATAARVSGRPVLHAGEIGDLASVTDDAAPVSEAYLDAHVVDRAGPRVLVALDGT